MHLSKRRLIQLTIILELIVIVALFFWFATKYQDDLFVQAVSLLDKDNVATVPTQELEHFYTLNAETIFRQDEPWLLKGVEQHITKQGFNDRYSYIKHVDQDTERIMAIGDSFTYGLYVDTHDSYPEQLEDMLGSMCSNDTEVINAGVPGYDAEYAATFYNEYGASFEPNVVLWLTHDSVQKINEELIPIVNTCRNADRDRSIEDNFGAVTHTCSREGVEQFEKEWSGGEVVAYHASAVTTLLSDPRQKFVLIEFKNIKPKVPTYIQNYFAKQAEKYDNVYYLELSVPIDKGNTYTLSDGHPNVRGHTAIAEEISTFLVNNELITCTTK